jgi:hypothetical protein
MNPDLRRGDRHPGALADPGLLFVEMPDKAPVADYDVTAARRAPRRTVSWLGGNRLFRLQPAFEGGSPALDGSFFRTLPRFDDVESIPGGLTANLGNEEPSRLVQDRRNGLEDGFGSVVVPHGSTPEGE